MQSSSSMFTEVDYNPETQEVKVVWRRDESSTTYYNVPRETGEAFLAAESHGKFYNSEIKNIFESDKSRAAAAMSETNDEKF